MKKTYVVEAIRSGKWWALEVPELPGAFSQTRRLDQASQTAHDLIAFVTKAPSHSFDVRIMPTLPVQLEGAVNRAKKARAEAETAQVWASALTREAVRGLLDIGLSVRDAGALLGITFQRVAQLSAKADPKGDESRQIPLAAMPQHRERGTVS